MKFAAYYLSGDKVPGREHAVTGTYTAAGVCYLQRDSGEDVALPPDMDAMFLPTKFIHYLERTAPTNNEFTVIVGTKEEVATAVALFGKIHDAEQGLLDYLGKAL